MGKNRITVLFVLWLILLWAPSASAFSVEQTQALMPEIDIYLYDESGELPSCSPADFQVQLEGVPLTVESLVPSEQGIFYTFMLDVSASIPQGHFDAAKRCIQNTYDAMRPQDQLSVIAFGTDVKVVLTGGESQKQVSAALDALSCQDAHTRFYDAMDVLIQTTAKTTNMRRVAVVISDGIDDSDAGMSQSDLEQLLQRSGNAVYALSIDSAGEETTAAFRRFVQLSGGELYLFNPANAAQVAEDLLLRVGTIWQLKATAATNMADGQPHTLSIRLKDAAPVSAAVTTAHWNPDRKAPQVLSLSVGESGTVTVTFSERMLGLEEPGHFSIETPDGRQLSPSAAPSDSGDAVTLSADGLAAKDGWTLALSGLTDASMEKNPLPPIKLSLADGLPVDGLPGDSAAVSESSASPAAAAEETASAFAVLTAVVLIGLLCALCLVFLLHRRKKAPRKPAAKDRPPEGQSVRFLFQNDSDKK